MASDFHRVVLPEGRELGRKASMTLLKHYAGCPRSGFLYQRHKGEGRSVELVRGAAGHAIFERATALMLQEGEQRVPPEVVKAIVGDVLEQYRVPWSEHDYLRELSYRWADEWAIDPRAVIACETLLALDVGGWQVRGKVDFAEARAGGQVVYVADYKTSRAAPSYDEVARKRTSDGRWAAKSFQLVMYALLLAFGQPVRVVSRECDSCDGNGFFGGDPGESRPCPNCRGSGTVRDEVIEPFPLAGRAERFDLELIYPAIEDSAGRMVRRYLSLNRLELAEYVGSLGATIGSLAESERTGDWPAIVSNEACGECPASSECPIPLELRDHRGGIEGPEHAAEVAAKLDRQADEQKAMRAALRAWVKEHGDLRYGANKVMRFKLVESEKIADKDALWQAVDRARDYGEPFERSRHVQSVQSSNFVSEKLSDAELAETA